jgi:hypothetical protein
MYCQRAIWAASMACLSDKLAKWVVNRHPERLLPRSLMLVMMMFVAACGSDVPTSGTVTIEAEADFSTRPVVGTFTVTEGADILGCSNGTYEDTYDVVTKEVDKVMTCSEPKTGAFTIVFDPDGYDTGPGEQNGPWRILDGSADFAELHGEGDFSMVTNGPDTGVETYTGDVEYTS